MSIFAANLAQHTEQYGFSCMRCKAITRSEPKITIPGDDCPTYLTLGQRLEVYCPSPMCRDMRTGEFVVITSMNATRVVDAAGNLVYPHGLSTFDQQQGQGYMNVPPPPNFAATGLVPPSPGSYLLQGTIAPPNTMPSPLTTSQNVASPPATATFSMPSNALFEKHLLNISDDEVKALKKDLQTKLQIIESTLHERRKCVICCERDKSVVLLPCKHQSLCSECSEKVSECPLCKKPIQDRILPFTG